MQFRVRMKATGTDGETRFVPNIMADELLAEEARTVYFNKVSYPSLGEGEFVNTALSDRARFGPSIENDELFTVTFMSSREATPSCYPVSSMGISQTCATVATSQGTRWN